MRNSYDKQNEEDYEENSILINECIQNIRNDIELKPTISQLSKLTGMHRNTLSNRIWPKQKLDGIKHEREEKIESIEKPAKKDQLKLLEEKLDKAKLELIYWFGETRDLQGSKTQLQVNLERMTESRDTYRYKLEKEREENKRLKSEVERLSDLINDIN